eukprot:scaffold6610_cov126-Skeletonema_marinoi.AAC.3
MHPSRHDSHSLTVPMALLCCVLFCRGDKARPHFAADGDDWWGEMSFLSSPPSSLRLRERKGRRSDHLKERSFLPPRFSPSSSSLGVVSHHAIRRLLAGNNVSSGNMKRIFDGEDHTACQL